MKDENVYYLIPSSISLNFSMDGTFYEFHHGF